MRNITLSIFGFLALAAASVAQEKDPKIYWQDTGLKIHHFEIEALQDCYDTPLKFQACFDSLNQLALQANPPLVVANEEEKTQDSITSINEEPLIGERVKKLKNNLAIYQSLISPAELKPKVEPALIWENETKNDLQIWKKKQTRQKNHLAVLKKLYEETNTKRYQISFRKILRELEKKLWPTRRQKQEKQDESYYASILLNEYYQIAQDAHAYLITASERNEELSSDAGNVEFYDITHQGEKYGYVKIKSFRPVTTVDHVEQAIEALTSESVKGLILDLRENLGGTRDNGVNVAGLFLGSKKLIVNVLDLGLGLMEPHRGDTYLPTSLPLVTIINGNSASASEIVAGALQNYGRSWIVGQRSDGKGTVQTSEPFSYGSGIYKFSTTGRFYFPSGRSNQITGIIPDFEVDSFLGATDEDRFVMREAELYPNALPAEGPPWVQPRPDEVKRINECRSSNGEAVSRPDDQRFVAAEVLRCELTK